mgnify:CR=1 FL=1
MCQFTINRKDDYVSKDKLTIEVWEEMFSKMKRENIPSGKRLMGGGSDLLDCSFTTYRRFINSVLKVIRKGEQDYCYYAYQIKDLLRFEPDLQVIYDAINEVFIVWLEEE